jgi:hypothetical protein
MGTSKLLRHCMTIKRRLPVTGVTYRDDNPPIMDNTLILLSSHKLIDVPVVTQGINFHRIRPAKGRYREIHVEQLLFSLAPWIGSIPR